MPTWRDRLDRAKKLAREKAPEVQARAEELAKQAREAAAEGSQRGRAKLDQTLDQRREAAERRRHWYQYTDSTTHTEGFPDEESMRESIEAAAAHGWSVVDISEVKRRRVPGGLTALVAREAVDRVRQPARFMVTFKRDEAQPAAEADGTAP